ncbi:M20/M25/M40 family metallo-hydrolase [Kribbella jiaozuonensis]|uniref:M20/M25/M40 family metallo-hydrolase n=1 Tax=Kribbella jiaozuonensis TaxID=2575441 RepID=A0A4V5UXB1_9ACTN|nr:M20/M25/M40 family metallo-hydrolase [Kribbella jiaozuonensis]
MSGSRSSRSSSSDSSDSSSRSSRRVFLAGSGAVAAGAVGAALVGGSAEAAGASSVGLEAAKFDGELRKLLRNVDPKRIGATIQRLTEFGTRHTLSSQTDPARGIGAATVWVGQQMDAIAATSGGKMTVARQSFIQPVSSRIPVPTQITNVIATLKGTASPERFYVVTGHLDSRVTDVMDFTSDAPGADDDGSGVACVLELARVFATHQFPGTIVFATVTGEEQGLYGSSFMAQQMAGAGNDVQGMFSNDIIGASRSFDGHKPDPFTVRMFLEGIPTNVTAAQISLLQSAGGENDGKARQLGRFVHSVAPKSLTGMDIRLVWRRDRFLRSSDHVSFQSLGYPAARFTEPRENFNHEHQNVQVVDGVQFGDLIDFVDFDYIARVTRVNAAALWGLATSPGTPKNAQIHTTPPGTLSGTNLTTLSWDANPETNLTGYEVVLRETTDSDWTSAIPVGNVTTVTLDISKDNVQMGIRAVDRNGNRSPAAAPQAVA